jgi:hypothetical protein
MSSGSLGSVVLILFIFSLIHLFLTLSIGIADIKRDWDKYKCNPVIIPFAGVFGHDPMKTSKECIKLTQVNFMSAFLQPIYAAIGFLSENGNFFSEIFSEIKIFGNTMQNDNFDFFKDVQNWFEGMSSELTITFEHFLNIFQSANNMFVNLGLGLYNVTNVPTSALAELPGFIIKLFE